MHCGIISDGNRKYAEKKNIFSKFRGHLTGKRALKKLLLYWAEKEEPKYLTVYAFSLYNLENRSKMEKKFIFKLMEKGSKQLLETKKIFENKIKVLFLGDKEKCPESTRKAMEKVEEKTEKHSGKTLSLCVCYDGQQEIVDAFNKIDGKATKEKIKNKLHTKDLPPLDLMIRTGGEKRISGFLLWDISYSEMIFRRELWPEYTPEMFEEDLKEFENRKRRFGK